MLTNFKLAASFVYVAVIDSEGLDNKIDIFVLLQLIVEKNSKRSVLAMKTWMMEDTLLHKISLKLHHGLREETYLAKTEDPWLTILKNQAAILFSRLSIVRNHLTHLSPVMKFQWLHQALPRACTARLLYSHVKLSLWSQRCRGRQFWVLENPSPPHYPQNPNQGSCQWKVMYNLNLVIVHSVLDETWC